MPSVSRRATRPRTSYDQSSPAFREIIARRRKLAYAETVNAIKVYRDAQDRQAQAWERVYALERELDDLHNLPQDVRNAEYRRWERLANFAMGEAIAAEQQLARLLIGWNDRAEYVGDPIHTACPDSGFLHDGRLYLATRHDPHDTPLGEQASDRSVLMRVVVVDAAGIVDPSTLELEVEG